eukprot:CAMPEP_0117002222 /NCGR_PEP_ID=MMETSP0472-20121206/3971_1 /TAXON_ID=693140 ORGANISM="Tiarina fusus, Strain LIS" /NCGR_SAMPLE_ID=MMETSP0472 /ASSEMBLY_ACC=CAM_ASM_000603 /LENGTH=896 /DNA_ID=CAMNT_0004702513 /DNA_START=204 /DNA_END=2894 /DNA_ORIENTATION=-
MSNEMKVQAEAGRHGGRGEYRGPGGSGSVSPSTFQPRYESSPNGRGYDGPQVEGEALRAVGGGALSAPPPPGFKSGGSDGRSGSNQSSMWTGQHEGGRQYDSAKGMPNSSSYTDLAAALGSGLAESMNDATRGEHKGALLTDNFFFNPKDDINYARQTRHAASRMLGTSPSKDAFGPSHKASDPGSLFSSFDSGPKGPPKKSFSGSSDLFGGVPKDRSSSRGDPTSALSAAFSSEAPDRLPSSNARVYEHKPPAPAPAYEDDGDVMRSRLRKTDDLGLTVMEPSDSYGRGASRTSGYNALGFQEEGRRGHDPTSEIQRDMQNLWTNKTQDRNADKRYDQSYGHSNSSDLGGDAILQAEEDLRPFTWDVRQQDTSRALAIVRASALPANEVRNICEALGVVETFRSDFSDRGVFFVSYYDMRAAHVAAVELQPRLQSLQQGPERILVQFCVPLNSSSQNDESLVVLNDIPMEVNIDSLAAMLSSYGAVRSLKSLGGNYGGSSFVVEYHDIQDAKQASLELESTQPWGSDVSVEAGARNPSDRKRGRELLALIGRWRHGGSAPRQGGARQSRPEPGAYVQPPARGLGHESPSDARTQYIPGGHGVRHDGRYERTAHHEPPPQLVLGPDGRYSYVVVNHSGYPPYGGPPPSHHGDRVYHSNHGHGTYVTHVSQPSNHHPQYWPEQNNHFSSGGSVVSASSYASHHSAPYPSGSRTVPYYADGGSVGSHSHMMSMPQPSSTGGGDDKDNRHLMLDLDAVENGRDSRTSLMVRNIPNKYTQQMLLSEFTENGHGPGIIDFFYLPIDFKNRCNRGYAFINFVDHRDILPFHRRYYGKHWRTFNSDKICDITYARIQGKSAMLKRFENSALMEKDEEYKPLVFVSHGPEKGTRLPFPDPSNKG